MPMVAFLDVKAQEPDFACAWYGPLFIELWRRRPTLAAAKVVRSSMRDFLRRTPATEGAGVGMLAIIMAGSDPPDLEARQEFAAMHNECMGKLVCTAFVVEERGFRGAALRSAVTAIGVLSKLNRKHEVGNIRAFDSLDSAALWMTPMVGPLGELPTALIALRGA